MVHDLTFWSVFTQLGALSRRQEIRPFHREADGLLIGEGVGIVALKRLDDALSDGDRIYAVIRGQGVSSDAGRASLMSPDIEGQTRAMNAAWRGLDKSLVGLIEAHGTGTPTGDSVELQSTQAVFGTEGSPIGIGSIKSNIGHTMPAAGVAGLIKAALSIYHGVKPPSLHLDTPHSLLADSLALSEAGDSSPSRLYPLTHAESWSEEERWAGVSAFGFGGINAHLALSTAPTYSPLRPPLMRRAEPQILLGVAAPDYASLAETLENLAHPNHPPITRSQDIGNGPARAALIGPDREKLLTAARLARAGKSRRGREGLWLTDQGLMTPAERSSNAGKLALMFPGIESTFAPRIDDLCARLGIATPHLYAPHDLGERGVSVVRLGLALDRCFKTLGVKPDLLCGHSIGEWTGMITAGYFPEEDIEPFIEGLDPAGLTVPDVAFIAVGAHYNKVCDVLTGHFDEPLDHLNITCSHDNCPHQSIFCTPLEHVASALMALNEAGLIASELPFRSGFHAPHFEPYADEMTRHLRTLRLCDPHRPLWSATTLAPYPRGDNEAVYQLGGQHLIEPVRFRALIERLYEEGVRVFVQMGVGSLSSFVSDTLRGRPHRVIDAHSEKRSAWSQWFQLAGALFVEGAAVKLETLHASGVQAEDSLSLNLGASLIKISSKQAQINESSTEHLVSTTDERPAINKRPATPLNVGTQLGPSTYPAPVHLSERGSPERIFTAQWELSIERYPHLRDHCFFRQPKQWPHLEDRFPVVPMTLSVQWVMEVAQQLADEVGQHLQVRGVQGVRAAKWIEIEPPQVVQVEAKWLSSEMIKVEIKGHLSATVNLSTIAPTVPNLEWSAQEGERIPPITGSQVYAERWMFHGPAYHGIHSLSGISPHGIRGIIENKGTPGALLDNVGQLFGLWVMLTQREDRVVMPVRLEAFKIFGPPPPLEAHLPCTVWIESVTKREVKARMALWYEGAIWATCEGWSDWRFETSGSLWSLMRYPERTLFSLPLLNDQGVTLTLADHISAVASSREFLVGRCLSGDERLEYRSLALDQQRDWIAGRIAAKDALRCAAWNAGAPSLFPIEVTLHPRRTHRPPLFVESPKTPLSISHCQGVAMAALLHQRGDSRSLGVDLQSVESRPYSWRKASFHSSELKELDGLPQSKHKEALTLWWSLKEAAAKCASHRGLTEGLGAPKEWLIEQWSNAQGINLNTQLSVLSQGRAVVNHLSSSQRFTIAWWIFDRGDQRWTCGLCVR